MTNNISLFFIIIIVQLLFLSGGECLAKQRQSSWHRPDGDFGSSEKEFSSADEDTDSNGIGTEDTDPVSEECHKFHHRKLSHELINIHQGISKSVVSYFAASINDFDKSRWLSGQMITVSNPQDLLSVELPSRDACTKGDLSSVQETAALHNCEMAVNAGLFNEHTKKCLGNIVHNGNVVQNSEGIKNAHFGITKDNKLFFGYLNEDTLKENMFKQLVGGTIWLLRNSKSVVKNSLKEECSKTQTTGSLQRFVEVRSARTAVGHDDQGRVKLVQIDGKTDLAGINLYELADLLLKHGFVNAINLDGGGSSSLVVNGTLVSMPSDFCSGSKDMVCPREVSSVLCVKRRETVRQTTTTVAETTSTSATHTSDCVVSCGAHGICSDNKCFCSHNYLGSTCAVPGACLNGGSRASSGKCICLPGFVGAVCEHQCSAGFYGTNCKLICSCPASDICDHVSGNCSKPTNKCVNLKPDGTLPSLRYLASIFKIKYWNSGHSFTSAFIALFLLFFVSFMINVYCLCLHCRRRCCRRKSTVQKVSREEFVKLMSDHDSDSF